MPESLSIRLVEHQPILRERLLSGLQARGVDARVGTVVEPGLWLVNVDLESDAATELLEALCSTPDTRVVISSVRTDLLDERARAYTIDGQIRRPFTLDQLRAYLVEVSTGTAVTSQEIEPATASHLDTMLDLAAAPAPVELHFDPDETIEIAPVRAHTPVPPPPVADAPADSAGAAYDSSVAMTVRLYAEAASELMQSWAELDRDERVRVMEEFLLRLSRELKR